MNIRRLISAFLMGVGGLAFGTANGADIFRILDHNGLPILNPAFGAYQQWLGCALQPITNNLSYVQCSNTPFSDIRAPGVTTMPTLTRGCPNETYPYTEPGDPLCYTRSYNVNFSPPLPPGIPRCVFGTYPSDTNRCSQPFRFFGAPTAPGDLVLSNWVVAFGSFAGPTSPCLEAPGSAQCTVYPPADGVTNPHPYVTLVYAPPVAAFTCQGFSTPFNQPLSLKKSNRAIPLKVQLFGPNQQLVTPATMTNGRGPVVSVSYTAGAGPAADMTSALLPSGQSSVGNQLNYDPATSMWWFNLDTAPFAALGSYAVQLRTGDDTKYVISPTCTGTFVR